MKRVNSPSRIATLSSAAPTIPKAVEVGSTVELLNGTKGTVRFIGETTFAQGVWIGIELFEPNGKNDGSVQGVRYFETQENYGVFVRESQINESVDVNAPRKTRSGRVYQPEKQERGRTLKRGSQSKIPVSPTRKSSRESKIPVSPTRKSSLESKRQSPKRSKIPVSPTRRPSSRQSIQSLPQSRQSVGSRQSIGSQPRQSIGSQPRQSIGSQKPLKPSPGKSPSRIPVSPTRKSEKTFVIPEEQETQIELQEQQQLYQELLERHESTVAHYEAKIQLLSEEQWNKTIGVLGISKETSLQQVKDQMDLFKLQNSRMELQIQQLNQEQALTRKEMEDLVKQRERLEGLLETREQEIRNLEQEDSREIDPKIMKLEAEIQTMEMQLDQVQQEKQRMKEKMDQTLKASQLADLERQKAADALNQSEKEKIRIQELLKQAETEKQRIQDAFNKSETDRHKLEQSLQQSEADRQPDEDVRIQSLESNVKRLKESLDEKQRDNKKLSQTLEQTLLDLDKLREQQSVTSGAQDLSQLSEIQESHKQQLTQIQESHKQQLTHLSEKHNQQLSQIQDTHKDQLSDLTEKQTLEIYHLTEKHQKQVLSLNQEITDLQSQIQKLSKKLTVMESKTKEKPKERQVESEKLKLLMQQVQMLEQDKQKLLRSQSKTREMEKEIQEMQQEMDLLKQTLKERPTVEISTAEKQSEKLIEREKQKDENTVQELQKVIQQLKNVCLLADNELMETRKELEEQLIQSTDLLVKLQKTQDELSETKKKSEQHSQELQELRESQRQLMMLQESNRVLNEQLSSLTQSVQEMEHLLSISNQLEDEYQKREQEMQLELQLNKKRILTLCSEMKSKDIRIEELKDQVLSLQTNPKTVNPDALLRLKLEIAEYDLGLSISLAEKLVKFIPSDMAESVLNGLDSFYTTEKINKKLEIIARHVSDPMSKTRCQRLLSLVQVIKQAVKTTDIQALSVLNSIDTRLSHSIETLLETQKCDLYQFDQQLEKLLDKTKKDQIQQAVQMDALKTIVVYVSNLDNHQSNKIANLVGQIEPYLKDHSLEDYLGDLLQESMELGQQSVQGISNDRHPRENVLSLMIVKLQTVLESVQGGKGLQTQEPLQSMWTLKMEEVKQEYERVLEVSKRVSVLEDQFNGSRTSLAIQRDLLNERELEIQLLKQKLDNAMEQNQEIHELEQQLRQQEREIARLESIKTQTTEKIVKQGHSDQILEYLMAEILRLRSKQATIDSMDLFHPFDPIYQQEIANVQSKSDLTNLFIDLKRTKSKSLDQQHAKSLVFEAELLSANYKIVDLSKKRDENKKYEKRQLYRQMQQVHLQVQEPKVSRPIGHLTLSSLEPRMCKTVIPFDDFYRLHHSIVQ